MIKQEDLLRLKLLIRSEDGQLLKAYLSHYITSEACKQRNAKEIKGMCALLHQLKTIPETFDNLKE